MRKIFYLSLLSIMSLAAKAEDVLQILPQPIMSGATYDDAAMFSVKLKSDIEYSILQFDIYLPAGMTIIDADDIMLSEERFPFTKDRKGNISFNHDVNIEIHPKEAEVPEFYRVLITNSALATFSAGDGVLCDIYYQTTALSDEILPVVVKHVVMTDPDMIQSKPADISSFLYLETTDWSVVNSIDLTREGCVTTTDIITATRSLMTNPNALLYVGEGSDAGDNSNVVVGDQCSSLSLTDGHPFHAPKAFTAASAEYVRTVPADGWYSLVLPFAADTEATVERYQSLDLGNNVINFATGSIEADVPCIFQAQAGDVTFTATNAPVAATPAELKDDCMQGFYSAQQAGSIDGRLALRADGTGFGTATANATVAPFRCVVNAPAATRSLRIVHNNEADGIAAMRDSRTPYAYTLNGLRDNLQTPGLHIADGKKIITK